MTGNQPPKDEISALLANLGNDDDSSNNNNNDTTTSISKPSDENKTPQDVPTIAGDVEDDPLAELRNLAARPAPNSRSSTPRMSSSATSVRKNTPPSTRSGRSSEEKAETDARTETRPKIYGAHPTSSSATQQDGTAAAAGGSWWGGLSSLASAAVKQAKGVVEEVQKNEEAVKWAEQVRGNYGALRGIGDDLRSRALPTFTNLLHTLAPPISQHERLQIHITHDIVGYPSLDPLIYQTFSRIMSQVEGGDLLVIQRGSESSQRRTSEAGYTGSAISISSWSDGPWWRSDESRRALGAVGGLVEGSKLARVSAESYAHEFFSARGGLEEAAKQATANLSESNPVRSSDIFLAIQPVSYTAQSDLFAGGNEMSEKSQSEKVVVDESKKPDELVAFAIYLYDPVHSITFSVMSQAFPQQWMQWMDAASSSAVHDGTQFVAQLPEEIQEIIASGGVDPREWISEWMEETLQLSVGIVAQRYVARRMGVGEGGIGRGKRREEIVDSGGGEAARAV